MSDNFEPPADSTGSQPAWLDFFGWQIPFGIFIVTFLVMNVIQLSLLIDQRKQLNDKKIEVDQALPRAGVVHDKLDGLARDVVELAKTDFNAKQIQDDLHIQISDNSQGNGAPNSTSATGAEPTPASPPTLSTPPAGQPMGKP